ncbi:SusC/RagA family TonB-linked outer membrane protein [Pedobacter sp. MC2016-14]|uniref:SusC/RagA family TonB-linked outer membrane protein n=1 Tax=Pedobacter sp. MC2016-14 TaxID=2897327 RepID=UPI001E556034|nr:SusC/RagA family TonB-linked outer membrane protein [Pedobacter sp. MC2016-14]MCD0489176.1 SusC/RagA family TonB-linked outer membrane protein [Pedobacter sp. MC2016-14]
MYKIYTGNTYALKSVYSKLLLIMRLTTVLLIACLMQVKASTFAQQITLDRKNAPLESILKEIRTQSGYDFFYDGKILPKGKVVDINVKNAGINVVMKSVLSGLPLTYTIEGKIVSIKKVEQPSFLERVISKLENIIVRGRIVDENGKPMPGASIFVKESTIRATSNENGEFQLDDVDENTTILIAFVGYQPIERKAVRNMGIIKMLPANTDLKEVSISFNTGYEQVARERSAGSFAKPDLNVMKNRSTSTNILDRLEGLIPGLSSGRSDVVAEGQRGGLVIRGSSSINLSTTPLVVVDGIEVPNIQAVNMQDVEDITVLKDATAASIWGAKAANGVIVITTKRGKSSSKLTIDYDGYYGFQGRPNRQYLPVLNSAQFITAQREIFPEYAAANSYASVEASGVIPPHLQILYDALPSRNKITQAQANFKLDSLASIDNRGQINDIFIRNAATLNQTLSISGGSEVHSFYGSVNHIGVRNNVTGSQDNQYKTNIRNDFKFGNRVTAFVNADLTNLIQKNTGTEDITPDAGFLPYQLFKDANGNPLVVNYMAPVTVIGYSDARRADFQARSRINLDYSPVLELDRRRENINNLSARMVAGGKVNILDNLYFQGTYGYNVVSNTGRTVLDDRNYIVRDDIMRYTQAPTLASVPIYNLPFDGGRLDTENSVTKSWTLRNQLFFNKDWDKHQLTVMAGQEATHIQEVTNGATYYGWDDQLQISRPIDVKKLADGINGVAGATGNYIVNNVRGGEQPVARTTSYYANMGYTYARKYTLNASWRIDESNLFGFDKSAQNRPVYSFGGKWALRNESFMEPLSWLDRLDVRLTYGITGNAPAPGEAASFDILEGESNPNYVTGAGIILTTPANNKLTWESTKVYNAGIDFSVFNGRLNATVDLYLKKTTDLIGQLFTSPLTGYSSVTGNFGDLENKGVDLQLSSVNLRTENFQWGSNLVLGYNKNKITKLNLNPATTGDGLVAATYLVGYPMFVSHAYNYAGLNASGDPQVKLADGTLTSAPNATLPGDIIYNGSTQAPWTAGLSNNFRYKSLELSVNMIYNGGHVMRDPRNPLSTTQLGFLDRWKTAGDENRTDIPRYVGDSEAAGERNNDYFSSGSQRFMSASYVKIRDITLGYGLPQSAVTKLRLQAINFRVQLSNLLLWTANDLNYDPEASGITRAAQGTLTLGAHITF